MRSRDIGFGIFLLSIGIIWVLINFGVIGWSIIDSLRVLWPLILVVIGVDVMFRDKPAVKTIAWLLFLAVLIGHSYYYPKIKTPEKYTERGNISLEKPAETQYGELKLNLGGVKLNLGSGTENLIDAAVNGAEVRHRESYSNGKERAEIRFDSQHKITVGIQTVTQDLDFKLNKDVAWDMDMDLGALSGTLDMRELKVNNFDMDVGAGDLRLIFGSRYEATKVKIDAGASKIDLIVPKDTGVRIQVDGLLNKSGLDGLGWEHNGKYYISPGYENAANKIEMDITMGVGKLSVTVD